MKVYLTQSTKNGGKFWQIETKGKKFVTTFGKIGGKGRKSEKSFGSKSECEKKAKNLVNEKKKKGYSKSKKRKKYESSESESESQSEEESSSESSSSSSSDSPPPKKKRRKKSTKKKKIFKEYKFVISGGLTSKTKNQFEKLIKDFGGLCTSTINKETDFVIVKKINPILTTAKCKKGIKLKIPIISEEFVIESIENNKLLKYTPYIIDEEEEDEDEDEESEESEESESDDNDNNDGKNKKSYKKVKMSGSAPVDEYFDNQSWTVFEENGIVWDAMLNQTNIGQNNNKFYKLQILTDSDESEFCAFFRWARVGYKGQMSRTWGNKQKCIGAFKKKFHDKTLNDWEDRDNFQSYARKYTYLPMDYGGDDDDDDDNDNDDEQKNDSIKSKLHSDIQDLVELIFDKKMMEKQMKEIGYDAAKLPLGKVDKTIIREAYEILKDIEDEINNKSKKSKKKRTRSSSSSSSSSQKVHSLTITELSSRYYTLIPHEFGFSVPPPINSEKALNKEMKLIEALSEIEVASRLLAKDKKNKKNGIDKHPIDKHFDLLKCSMESISTSCDEFKMLANYVKLTHATTHNRYSLSVERIFKLDRNGSDDRFSSFSKIPNRQLLWHGSRLTNFVGIISQGLRIAPPEAPVTGYMFGKGVYFADMCSKSANYCFTSPSSNTGLILLCEVALGEMNKLTHSDYYASNLPQGKLSTKGCGRTSPDPSTHITMDNGCIIPSGKSIKDNNMQTSLLYNEYIVYDTKQIKMRYLLKLKFNYHNANW